MQSGKQRIFGLDFVRAAAVVGVVFHHTLSYCHPPGWVRFFGPLGSLGVEALLVLSGYLIGRGLIQKSKEGRLSKLQHVGQFYVRRWLRTLPPYYFYLFIMAALFPPFFQQLIAHKEYFLFLQNFAWEMPSFYTQTWTLTLLEFFYFLFPLTLFLSSKIIRNRLVCLLVPVILFMGMPLVCRALHARIESVDGFEQTFRKLVIFHFDTPITGVVMALIEAEFPFVWAWILRHSWLGLAAFGGSAAYFLLGYPFLSSSHWLQVFLFPLVSVTIALVFPLLCNWKAGPSRLSSAVRSVSQVSYSLYVSHYFALSLGLVVLTVAGISREQWLIVYPLYALFIVLATYPSYYFVEEPFMRLRERKSPAPSYLSMLYGAVLRDIQTPVGEPRSARASVPSAKKEDGRLSSSDQLEVTGC